MTYPNSIPMLEASFAEALNTEITALAKKIVEGAKKLDLLTSQNLGVHPDYQISGELIERNSSNPIEFNHNSIIGAPGAGTPENPLQAGEEWNKGRRLSNTGLRYNFNAHGLPLNPYINAGITGRGLLWQYGPNHAVDNGLLITRPNLEGVPTLYAIGIHRKDRPNVPSLAGGFAKFNEVNGEYILDHESVIDSRLEEFFEEMISGSVELEPQYADLVESEYEEEIGRRMKSRSEPLGQDKLDEIHEQTVTHLKMRQVKDLDPEFFARLREVIASGKECFAGPVLNSNRQTNNAWIETRLSWVHLTDENWNYIRGNNPRFNYEFSAGDDADGVHYFEVNRDLIQNANSSHAPLFAFMAASFLLDAQENDIILDPSIIAQIEDVADFVGKISAPSKGNGNDRKGLEIQ